tara:strand:+ start:100 stop:426 length:327 start_codon:yes stop_codon:yes gene_type:complete
MAHGLYYKVKAYLGRDFTMEEVRLVKEPSTTNYSIAEWNISDEKAQPTVEQLDALESEATTLESNNQVINTRIKLYGTTAEQLEYIVENGVDSFIAKQNKIKTDNPKS